MTTRAGRGKKRQAKSRAGNVGDQGAERYMWVFSDGDHVVLSIPGVRDLELSCDDATTIGEMLIATAGDVSARGK